MLGVTPHISFKGTCREAIELYKVALGAEEVFCLTYGQSPMPDMGSPDAIMHATIKVGGSTVMLSDDLRPDSAPASGNISLGLGLDDADQARRIFSSLSAGGTVVMPIDKTFWAEAFGMLVDRFGVAWMINCEAPKA